LEENWKFAIYDILDAKPSKTLPATHRSKFGTRADALFILGYVHDSTTIWRFWDPRRRQVIQTSNATYPESDVSSGLDFSSGLGLGASSGLELDSSSGLGLDDSAVGLGLDDSAVGLGLGASSGLELNSSSGLGLDASAVGLGLDASSGLRLDASAVLLGLDASSGPTLGFGSSIVLGQKRPQALTHQIWVEEKPMDSSD